MNLSALHDTAERLKGKKLYVALLLVFILFIWAGLLVGYFISSRLSQHEPIYVEPSKNQSKEYLEGKVKYIDPINYPQDKISYVLTNLEGKEIILLKANDQKLAIAEGLTVKVGGSYSKTINGKEKVLIVDEVIIKNVSN